MSADDVPGHVVVLPHYRTTVFGFRPGKLKEAVPGQLVLPVVTPHPDESHADSAIRAVRTCLRMEPGEVITFVDAEREDGVVGALVALSSAPWPGPLWIDVAEVLEFQSPTDHPTEEFSGRGFLDKAFEVLKPS